MRLPTSILPVMALAFVSCESPEDTYDPTALQESPDSLVAGDTITFIPIIGTDLTHTTIVLDGSSTEIGNSSFDYSKSGNHIFTFIDSRPEASSTFDSVVEDLLQSISIDSEIMQLLRDTDQDNDTDFESPNLERIAEILSLYGFDLRLSEDGENIELPTENITYHEITSDRSAYLSGIISGRYTSETQGLLVAFRKGDTDDSRFFDGSAEFWVPYLSTDGFYEEDSEQGRFTMTLANTGQADAGSE